MRSLPLPAGLDDAFSVRAALEAGATPKQLRRLPSPAHGVRSLTAPSTLVDRLHALQAVLPERAVLSHVTAARLLGLWLPTRWQPDEPVHVSHMRSVNRPRRAGVVAHPLREPREVVRVGDFRVTTAAETWADLACELSLDELVVLGDSTLRFREPLAEPEDLERALARLRRGVVRARQAYDLVRPGSASAMETRARLLAVRAGLPEPELNAVVRDANGRYIGAFDLVWRDRRVIGEYDGDQHRTDRQQWQRDHRRLRAARAEGWVVITLTSDDIFRTPEATVALLREALT